MSALQVVLGSPQKCKSKILKDLLLQNQLNQGLDSCGPLPSLFKRRPPGSKNGAASGVLGSPFKYIGEI